MTLIEPFRIFSRNFNQTMLPLRAVPEPVPKRSRIITDVPEI